MTKLEQAITAIRSGDKTTGRQLLIEILETDKDDEQTWLWLTQALSDKQERITDFEKKFNPNTFQINSPNSSRGGEKSGTPSTGRVRWAVKGHLDKPHPTTDSLATSPRSKRHKFFMVGVLLISILLVLTFYFVFNRLSPLPQSPATLSTKLVTVTPSFASSISNMSIDVNISSPKISQIYLATFSLEEQDYLVVVTTEVGQLSNAVVEMNRLLEDPKLSDEAWRWDMATQVGLIRESHEVIFNTRPPEGLGDFHKVLVGTTSDCHQATKYLAIAFDDFDYAQAEIAGDFMTRCTTKLSNLDAELTKATSDL